MKHLIKKLLREGLLLTEEEYYNPTIPDETKRLSKKYVGKNVVWYGDPDQMIVIHKDYVHGMWGNVYNQEKMDYLVDMILNHEDMIEIECSYGMGGITTLTDVVEEQTSTIQGSFETDYENLNRPSTTGDDELDTYLGTDNLDEFDDIAGYVETYELFELFNDNKIFLGLGKVSLETVKTEFNQISDGSEGDRTAFEQFIKYEGMVKEAKESSSGDLGKFTVQLRDGHHRVMGAIKAGEEFVCLNLAKDDIDTFKGHYKKV
jgi:hypothetical protein